ncbi:MAG: CinA family protein [Bacillota bacterium]|jgi:nicotinamide-nucleotide amidase|nr:CinA family protein [Bacillota bacterium]HHU43270.1 CinA family protein [Clostridiales bacterium]
MREILKCYANSDEVEARLKMLKPDLENYSIYGENMDVTIVFEEISQDDYDDITEMLDDIIYNDRDVSLARTLVSFLRKNGLTIAVAESCTGGLISSAIVDIEGASDVFYEGMVTYSNLSKMTRLNVKSQTLEEFGAVSQETVLEMANGVLTESVDFGISISGIAGPEGGSLEKPVGLVYIGIVGQNSSEVIKNVFEGDRQKIRECAKNAALFYTLQHIKKYY